MEGLTLKPTKLSKISLFIFAPIFLILEYVLYFHFWKKIIIPELLTNDNIVGFLEKNDFEYKTNKIWKMDLIASNEFFDRLNIDEAKHVIKKEYVDAIAELLKENLSTNVEDYITVIVTTELKFVKQEGKTYKDKVYTVIIQFCRYYFLKQMIKKLNIWLLIAGILSILILLLNIFV